MFSAALGWEGRKYVTSSDGLAILGNAVVRGGGR